MFFSQFNWVDWTIIAVFIYYSFTGWQAGFADLGFSFVTFFISLWLAIKFHAPVGSFLSVKFGIPDNWTAVMGYVIVGFIAELLLSEIASLILLQLPQKLVSSTWNKVLGVLIAAFNGIVIISFLLLIISELPLRGTIKQDVQHSIIGSFIVTQTEKFGGPLNTTINDVKEKAVQFMTIEPESKDSVSLHVSPAAADLMADETDERQMLVLVNNERAKAGVGALTMDTRLVPVARAHSQDMFLRRYFSHITPEGLSPADRIQKAGIDYTDAGENLAYAPDLATAHTGLMNSPGHRANILDPNFHHVGIGIISTDSWGMMITQDFTN